MWLIRPKATFIRPDRDESLVLFFLLIGGLGLTGDRHGTETGLSCVPAAVVVGGVRLLEGSLEQGLPGLSRRPKPRTRP